MNQEPTPQQRLDVLRSRFRARAAGWWQVQGDHLDQVAFSAALELPAAVAREFAAATQSVSLTQSNLGIIGAATTGKATISRAAELPAETGSGLWLRRFGAVRSVAVPWLDETGTVVRVVSLALADETPDDATVVAIIRAETAHWPVD